MRRAARSLLVTLIAMGVAVAPSLPGPAVAAVPSPGVIRPADSGLTAQDSGLTAQDSGLTAQDSGSDEGSLYHAVVTPTPFADVRFVLTDHHRMFVSDADSVHVINDLGIVERTVTGLPGANGLAVSSDASTLFVSESTSDQIAAIDIATGQVLANYMVRACPSQMAVIGTTLYYAAGCSSAGVISHLDVLTGQDSGVDDAMLAHSDALLAATTDTVVAADGQLRSWQVTQAGFAGENDGSYFPHMLSLTAHGDSVVAIDADINSYGIYRPDLGSIRTYATVSYPTAIAWSADSSLIAGGSDTPKGNGIRLMSSVDGRVQLEASIPSLAGRDGYQAVAPGALMFSSDEATLIALTREWTHTGWAYSIARTSTTPASPSTVTVRITPGAAYGKPSRVEVHTPGRPEVRVLVTVVGASWHASRVVVTNEVGVGSVALVVPYSGTVTANLSGDLEHEAAKPATVHVRIPSALTVTMARGQRITRGVVHYGKLSDMRQRVLLSPRMKSRMVQVTLMVRTGRVWTKTRPFTVYTDANGYVNTLVKSARRGALYRLAYSFSGDTWNTSTSSVSPIFMLG